MVVRDGEMLGSGFNRRERSGDPLAHAELEAISKARARVDGWRFEDCEMVVTLEPCAMCAGALVNGRFARLVYGAADPKAGFCGSLGDLVRDPRLNHRLEVREGVLAEECGSLLSEFFSESSPAAIVLCKIDQGEVTEWPMVHDWKSCVR